MDKCEELDCPLREYYNDITCNWEITTPKCFGYLKEILYKEKRIREMFQPLRDLKEYRDIGKVFSD